MKKIEYPYIPKGREIQYVQEENEYMQETKKLWEKSSCVKHPTAAVVVAKDGKIIGQGSNAGKRVEVCPRWGSLTGTNYESCKKVCEQKGHAEVTAIEDAWNNNQATKDADLYLYGHWWCCNPCWDKMIEAGINKVFLLEKSWEIFNPGINTEMQGWGKPKEKKESEMKKTEEITEEEFDHCVLCGEVTEYKKETSIFYRKHYVEGAGQLCEKCGSTGIAGI